MSWIPPSTLADEYDRHNELEDEPKFIGERAADANASYYMPEDHRVESGHIDEEGNLVRDPDGESHDLDPEQELGEYLEEVGKEHGWDSLSEFARDHLEHEEASTE